MSPDEFWSRVDRAAGPGACWPWQGCLDANGYGWLRWQGRRARAHRVALELDGRPVPAGWHGIHLCNVKRCCNPAHLRPGPQCENPSPQRGRILTAAQRAEIRRFYGRGLATSVELSQLYGVSASTIRHMMEVV